MSYRLTIIAGPDQGKSFPVPEAGPVVIGRGRNAAAALGDQRVSRVHCEVKVEGSQIMVADLGSAGGTFVNGTRVQQQPLRPGDVLRVGDSQLRLEAEGAAEMATLAPEPSPKLRPPRAARQNALPVLPAERLRELSGETISHYQLGPVLAAGRTGVLFRAHDTKHDRETAFKVLWPHFAEDDGEVRRFVRAMRTILPLRHPNLVALYGAGRAQPYCWLAMEYVDGEALSQILGRAATAGPPGWRLAVRVLIHVARGLVFAHEQQVVHRNITPQNIMIRREDQAAKVGDLMLAKALDDTVAAQVTRPGEILGDVLYMSPERTTGGLMASDARSDLYSLGATAYALLTGRAPLHGTSFVDTVLKIRQEAPLPPRQLQPAVPAPLEAVVLKLLAKRPEDRFQTAQELLNHLRPLVQSGLGR
jgi:serine/threonine protein kinase